MNKENLKRISTYTRENMKDSYIDIYDALEYTREVFEDVYNKFYFDINDSFKNKDLEKCDDILNMSKILLDTIADLKSSIDYFNCNSDEQASKGTHQISIFNLEENTYTTNLNDIKENINKTPNYSLYAVDPNIKHTLHEDYQNKKVCGFIFRDKYYKVSTMKDMIIKLCSILYKDNPNAFEKLLYNPNMKGKKIKYISYEQVTENGVVKNYKISGSNLFIWTNISSNTKITLIKKIFDTLNINENDLYIFLRSDYSGLRKKI